MAVSRGVILAQIDAVLGTYEQARGRSAYDDISDLGNVTTSQAIARLAATIDRLAPPGSQYRESAKEALKPYGPDNGYNVPILVGYLRALRADYEAGHLQRVEALVQADIFADFLEMAEHLLEQGYKDPAAGFADKKAAERRANEIELDIRAGIHGRKSTIPSFAEWWNVYRRTYTPLKSARSRDAQIVAHFPPTSAQGGSTRSQSRTSFDT